MDQVQSIKSCQDLDNVNYVHFIIKLNIKKFNSIKRKIIICNI